MDGEEFEYHYRATCRGGLPLGRIGTNELLESGDTILVSDMECLVVAVDSQRSVVECIIR